MYVKMGELTVGKVVEALPPSVTVAMRYFGPKLILAGGAIRDAIQGEAPKDFDLFPADQTTLERAKAFFEGALEVDAIEHPNAFTFKRRGGDVQLIHRWFFDDSSKLLDVFDFTVAQACIWFCEGRYLGEMSGHFLVDSAEKTLTYTGKGVAGGSMLRAFKFARRGYHISPESIAAIVGRLPTTTPNIVRALREVDPSTGRFG